MDRPTDWYKFLAWAEFSYNTSFHEGLQTTPFQAVYGRAPPTIPMYIRGQSKLDAVDQDLATREEILASLKANLLRAQQRMKVQADKHRRDIQFQEGELVYVKLQPYRQTSISGGFHKLSKRFYGPYRVLKRIGSCAYEIALPSDSRIHNVFHVSVLKPAHGTAFPSLELPPNSYDNKPLLEPLVVLDSRVIMRNNREVVQLLVQWSGLHPEDSTWEDLDQFRTLYPTYNLEDKVVFQGQEKVDTTGLTNKPTKMKSLKEIYGKTVK